MQLQNVPGSAVVVFCPDVSFVGNLNQLRCDSNPPATAPNGSFEHIVDSKLAANLGDSLPRALEHHARGSCDDAESVRIEAAQLGDHFFSQSVAEVIESLSRAQVFERQHGEHRSAVRDLFPVGCRLLDRRNKAVAALGDRRDIGTATRVAP